MHAEWRKLQQDNDSLKKAIYLCMQSLSYKNKAFLYCDSAQKYCVSVYVDEINEHKKTRSEKESFKKALGIWKPIGISSLILNAIFVALII